MGTWCVLRHREMTWESYPLSPLFKVIKFLVWKWKPCFWLLPIHTFLGAVSQTQIIWTNSGFKLHFIYRLSIEGVLVQKTSPPNLGFGWAQTRWDVNVWVPVLDDALVLYFVSGCLTFSVSGSRNTLLVIWKLWPWLRGVDSFSSEHTADWLDCLDLRHWQMVEKNIHMRYAGEWNIYQLSVCWLFVVYVVNVT